jgi:hypothetical protein
MLSGSKEFTQLSVGGVAFETGGLEKLLVTPLPY